MTFSIFKFRMLFFHALIQTFQESDNLHLVWVQKINILFYFGQVFSVLFKFYISKFHEKSILILSYIFLTFDFSNILIFFRSDQIYYILLYSLAGLLIIIFISYLTYAFVWRKIAKRMVVYINTVYKYFCTLFFWSFYIPFINLFINGFQNQWYSFHDNAGSIENNAVSVIGCVYAVFLGFLTLYFNRNYDFCQFNGMKVNYNIYWFIIFLIRTFTIVMYSFLEKNSFLVYFILGAFSILTLYHFFVFKPLRNPELSKFYISTLISFLVITIELAIHDFFNWISERNLFFVILITVVSSFKLGSKIQAVLDARKLLRQIARSKFVSVSILEDIKILSVKYLKNEQFRFEFLGLIKNHQKNCKSSDCKKITTKIQEIGLDLFTLDELVNKFIELKFRISQKQSKKAKFLYQYLTFFQKFESNLVRSFYEIERASHIFNIDSKDGFYDLICTVIRENAVYKLKNMEKIKNTPPSDKKSIDLPTFFGAMKLKEGYERDVKEILNDKRSFWESYLTSIQSMQELMSLSCHLAIKIEKLSKKLELNSKKSNNNVIKFVNLKFSTIFHSVIVNTVNSSIKYQEELDNLHKNTGSMDAKELNHKSFLDNNTVTCMISFKNKVGMLKNQEKNIKLARLFEYNLEDLKNLNQVEIFMPKAISKNHSSLLEAFIKGNKKKSEKYKGIVNSYGVNKHGFVFPARIHGGLSFDFKDDFVMIGAIMSLETKNLQTWLCEDGGQSVNISKGLFNFFQQKYPRIRVEDFHLFNIFSFFPFLDEAIKKNQDHIEGRNSFYMRNLQGYLILPQKINSILDILREKHKEEVTVKDWTERSITQTFLSSHQEKNVEKEDEQEKKIKKQITEKTVTTTMKQGSRYLNTIEKTLGNNPNKALLIKKFQNNELTNMDIVNAFLETIPTDKYQVTIDVSYHRHFYGDEDNDNFSIFSLTTNLNHHDLLNRTAQTERTNKSEEEELHTLINKVNEVPNNDVVIKKIFSRTEKIPQKEEIPLHESEKNLENKLIQPQNLLERQDPNSDNLHSELKEDNKDDLRKNQSDISQDAGEDEDILKQDKSFKGLCAKNQDDRIENSQGSSTNSIKQAFLIFSKMKLIQNSVPLGIQRNFFAVLIELFIILFYCMIYWIFASSYVDNYHKPIQKHLINLCRMGTATYLATTVAIEYEYERLNLTSLAGSETFFRELLQNNFETIHNVDVIKISETSDFEYQNLYKNYQVNIVDFQSKKLKSISYSELVTLNSLIVKSLISSPREVNYDELINLQRNVVAFINATTVLQLSMENNFLNSNKQTTDGLLVLMIVFLTIEMVLKIFEFKLLYNYQNRISQLLNLLKRVNENDATKEIMFCDEIIRIMNDNSEVYLKINFSERSVNRTDPDMERISIVNNDSGQLKGQEKSKFKKKSMYDFKPFPVFRIILFVAIFFIFCFSFLFFNFYYWSSINQNIQNLIHINIFFEKLYYCTMTTFCIQQNLIRTHIIPDNDYEIIKDPFQTKKERIDIFQYNFDLRMGILKNIVAFSLGQYTLEAKSDINSVIFNNLVQEDVCQVLIDQNVMSNENLSLCRISLNEAFKRGIISAVNEYLNQLTTMETMVNSETYDLKNDQKFKNYIQSSQNKDFIKSAEFLNLALFQYYSFLSENYNSSMEKQITGMKIFLLSTTILLFIVTLILALFVKLFLRKAYKYSALTLGLIPLDRILNDQPTIFLINQFVKEEQSEKI